VAAFLRDAQGRNLTASSLENYRTFLLGPRARQFLVDHQISEVGDVTTAKLRAFEAELAEAGLAPASVATFHRVVRNFLGFCRREGWPVSEEVVALKAPREPLTEPSTFTDEEERRLLAGAHSERDRVLIEFMLRTGLRRSEVVAVTLDDIVDGPEGAFVRVRQGKGRKDRIVPLDTGGTKFSRRLAVYIRKVRPQSRDRHLFLSLRRDPETGEYRGLDDYSIRSTLARLGEETGIHCHPHKFRHTFATRALRAGVDSLVLQRALGHSTLAMVNRYVHFQARDLLEAWRARSD
jgi:integrase/recombinase XerD